MSHEGSSRSVTARQWPSHLLLALVTLVTLYPLLIVVRIALSPGNSGFTSSLDPIPEDVSLDNLIAVVSRTAADGSWVFGQQALNSIIIAAVTTVFAIFLATTAAYAFSRFRFPGRRVALLAFLISQMFPGVLMLIPLYQLLEEFGLLNHLVGLIIVYSTTAIPFCVWMLKGYFDTIPRELEEAAIMDGASQFTIFWRIMLPLAMPAVAVTALFAFMTAWNEFILAFTFMSEESAMTLPVMVNNYVGENSVQWGLFAAASLVVSLPVIALFYGLQKHLVGGLTSGAVKG